MEKGDLMIARSQTEKECWLLIVSLTFLSSTQVFLLPIFPLFVQMFTTSLNKEVNACILYDCSFPDGLGAMQNIWIMSSLDKQECNFLRITMTLER